MRDEVWGVWVYILYTTTMTTGAADLKAESQTEKPARGPISPARRARARADLGAARASAWPARGRCPAALVREDARPCRTGSGAVRYSDTFLVGDGSPPLISSPSLRSSQPLRSLGFTAHPFIDAISTLPFTHAKIDQRFMSGRIQLWSEATARLIINKIPFLFLINWVSVNWIIARP